MNFTILQVGHFDRLKLINRFLRQIFSFDRETEQCANVPQMVPFAPSRQVKIVDILLNHCPGNASDQVVWKCLAKLVESAFEVFEMELGALRTLALSNSSTTSSMVRFSNAAGFLCA